MKLRRVVVTGLGAVSPIGNDVPTMWENAKAGVSGAGPITHFDASMFKTNFACEVKNFDAAEFLDKKEVRKVDAHSHFGIAAAMEAMRDCGIDLEKENLDRFGVIYGEGVGGLRAFEQEYGSFVLNQSNGPRFTPFLITKMITDMTCGMLSIKYGLKGPNYVTTSACASSSNAIIDAFDQIRLGRADVMLAGGAEAAICHVGVGGFNSMHALSTRNDEYEKASRPFSKSRDGFVIGEGGACLVLEEYEHAKARGAKIYAEVAGTGLSADAYHMTAPLPNGEGAAKVMMYALEEAGLKPEDIDYINTHGTSTPAGDIAEVAAIKSVFGEHAYKLNIGSTKSMTGHLLGGAGALEAVLTVLSVKNDIVPPTINHAEGDEDENIDYNLNFTFNKAQERVVNAAISNTFGFGGHNTSIAFKKI
ncbi:MAG: beta-ketoacyl-ACP synthase II [Bacteroidaceae bacterium]|nr:beta-ketoacyl-ACP synthase II [Bacteroidaceae bacterium]MBQ3122146.1 beta-ketoacyl-ACP synthase II [Bacteroidaceae bacterium]MBQ4039398.1 beta-ketoacyl-ACP synthase II [Bacteroidaceae bacterium]